MSSVKAGAAVRLGVLTGVGGLVLALLGALVATSSDSATSGVATRAVLVTVLLVVATRITLAGLSLRALVPTALVGLLLGYLLTLGWFNGQVYAAKLMTGQPALAAGLDLVLWLAVGLGAAKTVPVVREQPQGYR